MCADSTYQLNWQDFPLNVIGTSDTMGQFHVVAMSLSTNETSSDYEFLFTSVKEAVATHLNVKIEPHFLIG